jgi:hypothetical protein
MVASEKMKGWMYLQDNQHTSWSATAASQPKPVTLPVVAPSGYAVGDCWRHLRHVEVVRSHCI